MEEHSVVVSHYSGHSFAYRTVDKADGLLLIVKEDVPDSDNLIVTDQGGFSYKRVIVPENTHLFRRV